MHSGTHEEVGLLMQTFSTRLGSSEKFGENCFLEELTEVVQTPSLAEN